MSLRIRGKLIFSFSMAMIVLLSALGTITYFTFKDTISSSKKRIAELTLQNHILGFHDLVEELQHNVSETLFAADIGFSNNSVTELVETLGARTDADPFLKDMVLVKADQIIYPSENADTRQLQEKLTVTPEKLKHGLLMSANTVWIHYPLSEAVGPDMAAFFSLDQHTVWETILHENEREPGTLFFVTSDSEVIMSHPESADHYHDVGETATRDRHRSASHHDDDTGHDDQHSGHDSDNSHDDGEHHDEHGHEADDTHAADEHDDEHRHEAADTHAADEHGDEHGQEAADTHAASDVHLDSSLLQLAADDEQLMTLSRLVGSRNNELTRVDHNYIVGDELGLLDWHVFSLIPESLFVADLITLRNRIITATALTFWISLWIVLIVAHRISKPLVSLSAATRDIQLHNYSTPLQFGRRRDEIGDLASSFETMRQDIEQLIYNDTLTGVFNRRYLLKMLNLQVAEAMQSNQTISFIMIDLDCFKAINDTHGHMAGDAMLKASATTIASVVGDIGILARYGGEEFCALLPGVTALQAQEVAERIRVAMQALVVDFDDQALSVTCSQGIADIDSIANARQMKWAQVVNLLITHADLALYHAKDSGRNRSVIISPDLLIDKAA